MEPELVRIPRKIKKKLKGQVRRKYKKDTYVCWKNKQWLGPKYIFESI